MIIRNGLIVDGTGAPGYQADVAIDQGRIARIGELASASSRETLWADGLIVAPGFIDIHSHDDLYVLEDKWNEAKLHQGVTTTVIGNCGFGLFPVLSEAKRMFETYATSLFGPSSTERLGFASAHDYFHALQEQGSMLNVASLTAHGVLRISVMGFANRAPSTDELKRMEQLLRDSMDSGSMGLSLGLIYPPGSYAQTEELIALSKVVSDKGGFVACHMRNEGNALLESVQEVLTIAKLANVPLEISHLKAIGHENHGKALQALQLIESARRQGVDVTFDQYPYVAGSTTATTLLPPWALEGGIELMLQRLHDPDYCKKIKRDIVNGIPGSQWETMWRLIGWEQIMVSSVHSEKNKRFEGMRMSEIAELCEEEPVDCLLTILREEQGNVMIITFIQDESEMEQMMGHPLQMFGTDGLPKKGGKAHPRLYGTYPKVLGTYVRDSQRLTLEQAIHKMTGAPARRLGLRARGQIQIEKAADVVLIHMDTVSDLSTYIEPDRKPRGIEAVLINGELVLNKEGLTGKRPGRPLFHHTTSFHS